MKPPPPPPTHSPALAPISPLEIFDLKSQQRGRSLSLLIKKQCRVFSSWRPFAGSRLSVLPLSLSVPFLFGWQRATPALQRYIEVAQNICHGAGDQRAEGGASCPAHLKPARSRAPTFVVDMTENVCCRAAKGLRRHRRFLFFFFPPYHCFNALCRGRGI